MVQSLCSKHSHLDQVLADDVQHLQRQKLLRLSQQHVSVFGTLTVKKFSLYSSGISHISVCANSLLFFQWTHLAGSTSFSVPAQTFVHVDNKLLNFLFCSLNSPISLSFSLHIRIGSNPLIISVIHFKTHPNMSMSSCPGEPWPGQNTPTMVLPGLSQGGRSTISLNLAVPRPVEPGCCWPPLQKDAFLDSNFYCIPVGSAVTQPVSPQLPRCRGTCPAHSTDRNSTTRAGPRKRVHVGLPCHH